MFNSADIAPDMPLIAIGVVIWVVAVSVAFGFYIPVLRAASQRTDAARKAAAPAPHAGDVTAAEGEASAHLADAPPVTKATVTVVEPPVADVAPTPAPASAPAPAPGAVAPATPPDAFSVLIVDDNAVNRRVLEIILDSVGVAYVSVENGLEAVEAMEACPHHAVLMDLQMPVMDGFEATRRIRALQAMRGDAPSAIIVVSANCLDEHVAAGRDAGADSHLAKPISAAALICELATCSGALMAA
jgi:CheY-like chemotaxis protein